MRDILAGTGTETSPAPAQRGRREGGHLSRRTYLKAVAAAAPGVLLGALRVRRVGAQEEGEAPEEIPEAMPEEIAPPAPRVAGPLSGTFRIWISAYFPVSGDPMWKEMFDAFQAKHPSLRLEIGEGATRGDAEVFAKITTAVAGGDPEDILHHGGVFAPDYARQGMIRSLEPYFATSTLLQKTDLWPAWLADSLYKDENYALNFAGDVRLLYLHKNAWQRAGLDTRRAPRTWNELEEALPRLARRGSSGDLEIVGFNPSSVPWWWWVWQLGGEVVDPSGERVLLDRGDAAVRALEFIMRLYNAQGGRDAFTKFHVANGAAEAVAGNPSAGDYNAMFQRGAVATYLNTYSHRSEQFRRQGFQDDNWDFTAVPVPPAGRSVNWGGSHAFGIPSLAKNPEAGWAWLEHFSLLENDLKFATRYDRVPLRRETAISDAYLRGDPFLAHQSEQAWGRRFLPAVPGLSDILPIWNRPVAEVYTGQKNPRDAVGQVAQEMQVALDRATGKIR